jgi:muramidase (phage lysozyme)
VNENRVIFVVLAIVAGLGFALWQRQASAVDDVTQDAADAPEQPDDGSGNTDTDNATVDAVDEANPFAQAAGANMAQDTADANVQAGLDTIKLSEGTGNAADPYAVCYGYKHTVQDYTRHPAEWYTDASGQRTREWGGEPLDNLGPSYAGLVSTAAGAFQIKLATWAGCKKALALPDFSKASQDAAAVYLIQGRKGLDALKAGNFDAFVALCAPEWASLPGANYAGQSMQAIQTLRDEFVSDGGTIV